MDLTHDEQLTTLKTSLLDDMREYMAEGDVEHDADHIEECGRVLDAHLAALAAAGDRDAGLACVRETVLKLNELNERAGEELIETGERETICEFIIRAGALLGHNTEDEDVTEEWREGSGRLDPPAHAALVLEVLLAELAREVLLLRHDSEALEHPRAQHI